MKNETITATNLVICNECGKEKSRKANACPHCGAAKHSPWFYFLWFLVIAIMTPTILAAAPYVFAGIAASSFSAVKSIGPGCISILEDIASNPGFYIFMIFTLAMIALFMVRAAFSSDKK